MKYSIGILAGLPVRIYGCLPGLLQWRWEPDTVLSAQKSGVDGMKWDNKAGATCGADRRELSDS
ncbi:hypothetical protein [Granulosicoccus antarcticus]|uniref:hypothetical protein n=1 Tax=Granulosicoccus antarcticus TaxID=437505 RepID=UPI0012FD131C|nr:hypothetical protein [Granulosicoccus antarcticus]